MDLCEQGNMFTDTSFGEDIMGIQDDSFMIDLDLDIRKLSISPTPYQSTCVAADISSLSMVEADVSGADLHSAFDSICAHKSHELRDGVAPDIKADTFDSVGQAYLPRQCSGDGQDIANFDSCDLADVVDLSAPKDGETKDLVGIDKTCIQSHSLIVYTSSRRRSARNTKPIQKNESSKPSKCRIVANKCPEFDISSLQILRRSRSSFAKRARSSVWGDLGNILPDIDKSSRFVQSLGDERKQRSGKGKRKGIKEQAGKKSIGKSVVPTGRISLKVKIGNKFCSPGNTFENLSASKKDVSQLIDTKENKLGEEVSRDVVSPCETNLEKMMSSDGSALSTHLQIRDTCYNQSFDTSSNFHETRRLEEGDSLRGLTEIQCSDVGTSPDSEVINSIPDVPLCEKGLPDLQDGAIVSKVLVSPTDVSGLILSPKHFKKEKKKVKLPQVDNCMWGSKQTGAGTRNNATAPAPMKDVSSLSSPRTKSKKGRKKDKLCNTGNSVETNLKGIATVNLANGPTDLGVGRDYNGADTKPCSGLVVTSIVSNSTVCDTLVPCSNERKFPKCSSSKGRNSRDFPSEKEIASRKKGIKNDFDGKHLVIASGYHNRVQSSASMYLLITVPKNRICINSFPQTPFSYFTYLPSQDCKMIFLMFLLIFQEMKHHLILEELEH